MLLTLAFLACGQLVNTEFVEVRTIIVKADTNRAYWVMRLNPATTTAYVIPWDGKILATELPPGDNWFGAVPLRLEGEFRRLDNPVKCHQIYSEAVRECRKVKVPAKPKPTNKVDSRLYPKALKRATEAQLKAVRAVADKHKLTSEQLTDIIAVGVANGWPVWPAEKEPEASKTAKAH
jgi:hypothetical protein